MGSMRWDGEEFALVLTGVAYFAALGLPMLGKATIPRSMRWLILVAGAVFVGASVVLASHPRYPASWVVWLLPLVPIVVIISLVRDYAREQAAAGASTASAPTASATTAPATSPNASTPSATEARTTLDPQPTPTDDAAARDAADPDSSAEHLADLAYGHPELHELLALNPGTPASVLEWMASLGDPVVTGAIGERASHE